MRAQSTTVEETPQRLRLYGLKEAAGLLGVSSAFLRLEVLRGRLRVVRLGRRVLLRQTELARYLDRGEEAGQ
jgi:excisionase family DNA binding protein